MSRGRPVTVGLLAVAALAACQAGEPSATPTTLRTPTSGTAATSGTETPSASSSPNGNPTALASVPAAARQHTAAGAEAFAKFYLGQVNKAWMKPDPDLIRPLALPTCKTCANFVGNAEYLHSNHLRYDGPASKSGASVVLPESTKDLVRIQLVSDQNARRILRADGSVKGRVAFLHSLSEIEARWQGSDGWRIGEVKVVKT